MKIGDCRGDPQVVRVVDVDQVQPSGELRLAPTNRGSWTSAAFSEQEKANSEVGPILIAVTFLE
jgi:hypothetical protein